MDLFFFTHPLFIFNNSIFLFGPCHMIYANGVINDPYIFAHFHLSSQVNASAAVDCHAFMMIC